MPFKSEAQRRYFEANKTKLEKQGVDVKEWEESSRGLKLPERVPRKKSRAKSSPKRLVVGSVVASHSRDRLLEFTDLRI